MLEIESTVSGSGDRGGRADISGWISGWAAWRPAKTALRYEGRQISYDELEAEVAALAGALRADGVAPGDRVGYLGPNCPELLALLFACARVAGIFVPLNARMPTSELRVFLKATRPRLLVASQSLGRTAADAAAAVGTARVMTFRPGGGLAGIAPAAERLRSGSCDTGTAPVLILFTSGTTGQPKGATFAAHSLVFGAVNVLSAFGLTASDEILTAVPMFHAGGLLIHTLPGLCAGATVTIHGAFHPGQVLNEIQRRGITLLASVPAMTRALASDPRWDETDLTSLRLVVTGSTTVPASAIEAWQRRGISVVQGYGGTEASPIATTMPPGSPPQAAFTAGKPTIHTQVRVVGPGDTATAAGEPGEVWIRGPAVMQGYWENAQATRAVLSDGWFHTGDLGLLDDDGCLRIVGRLTDVIIVGGSNVHPADLEAVLGECPGIREAAVVGTPDEVLGEVPVAFVAASPGATLSSPRVLDLFRRRVAAYKHPREVIFLDALPRTATDKVDRRRLRRMAAQRQRFAPH